MNPLLDTYRRHIAQQIERTNQLLPAPSPLRHEPTDPVMRKARELWRPIPGDLGAIDAAITNLSEQITRISLDADLTEQARADRINTAATTAQNTIAAARGRILPAVDNVLATLRAAAYPARPQGDTATQEAQLAGIKSDLRMMLDPASDSAVLERLQAELRRAVADRNDLAAWLLATSPWPEQLLVSRGLDSHVPLWRANVAQMLSTDSPAALDAHRRVYTALADPRDGLGQLPVLLGGYLTKITALASEWRPGAWSGSGTSPFA